MTKDAPVAGSTEGMEGDIGSFSVLDMLHWLHASKRSVVMRISAGGAPAWIFVLSGEVQRAEWRHLRGAEAVYALAGLDHGTFWLSKHLATDAAAMDPNVTTPTAQLLLQCAVLLDEGNVRPAA